MVLVRLYMQVIRSKTVNPPGKDLGLFCIHMVPGSTLIEGYTILQIRNNGIHKKLN